jgi:hypothetical protein
MAGCDGAKSSASMEEEVISVATCFTYIVYACLDHHRPALLNF